jgi:voltage-gated potassium channel Kch
MTTVTTVGYGDRFSTTAGGRGVGIVLMVLGIAFFGFLAGALASFFVEGREEEGGPQAPGDCGQTGRIEKRLGTTEGRD